MPILHFPSRRARRQSLLSRVISDSITFAQKVIEKTGHLGHKLNKGLNDIQSKTLNFILYTVVGLPKPPASGQPEHRSEESLEALKKILTAVDIAHISWNIYRSLNGSESVAILGKQSWGDFLAEQLSVDRRNPMPGDHAVALAQWAKSEVGTSNLGVFANSLKADVSEETYLKILLYLVTYHSNHGEIPHGEQDLTLEEMIRQYDSAGIFSRNFEELAEQGSHALPEDQRLFSRLQREHVRAQILAGLRESLNAIGNSKNNPAKDQNLISKQQERYRKRLNDFLQHVNSRQIREAEEVPYETEDQPVHATCPQ